MSIYSNHWVKVLVTGIKLVAQHLQNHFVNIILAIAKEKKMSSTDFVNDSPNLVALHLTLFALYF